MEVHTRTTKKVNIHGAADKKAPADYVTKLNLNSSSQAERPIGASAVKILASGGKDPKGATSTIRETRKEAG